MALTDEMKCSTCEHGRTEFCNAESICLSASAWEPRGEDVMKTCDDCKYGDNTDCQSLIGNCDDYSKWEPKDVVNYPSHYRALPIEVIYIIEKVLTEEEFRGFCLGNIIKYRMRAGLKDPEAIVQDIEKANWYMEKINEG